MPINTKKYRDHLYQHREHPEDSPVMADDRDSFFTVYLSAIPFLAMEYFAELKVSVLPSGLVFPVGYLLFWAFYYTYYKPGYLESRLSNTDEWDFASIPTVLLGVLVWFIKVTVLGAIDMFLRPLGLGAPAPERNAQRARTFHSSTTAGQFDPRAAGRPGPEPRASQSARTASPQQPRPRQQPPGPPPLPAEFQQALVTLGIPQCREWNVVHHRYRELAKKYHPDLNPELTDVGRRFMMYDGAYRKLCQVRTRYFK